MHTYFLANIGYKPSAKLRRHYGISLLVLLQIFMVRHCGGDPILRNQKTWTNHLVGTVLEASSLTINSHRFILPGRKSSQNPLYLIVCELKLQPAWSDMVTGTIAM